MIHKLLLAGALVFLFNACPSPTAQVVQTPTGEKEGSSITRGANPSAPFVWENANMYFLLTDRFNNGNPDNDLNFGRQPDGAQLRNFMGGDFKGITQKLTEGYFDQLGVNALWFTPPIEQIHSFTDEGTGKTYGYHGYWARDWTALDPNYGTLEEFRELVAEAHKHGIRIIWDAVINHTGPVTPIDTQWPDAWVRTDPTCVYQDYETTVECTLVDNLPDIKTESEAPVELPPFLVEKWKAEGRYEAEIQELEAFFDRTGLPKAPKYYIMKWLTDWVREFGIDGFRVDTAKHTEADIWAELKKLAEEALAEWKQAHPGEKLDDLDFFMTGEVYGYSLHGGRDYDYGDRKVDFFDSGFESLINFAFKGDANQEYEPLFSRYSEVLHQGALQGVSILNYGSSHDDGSPFDRDRKRAKELGTKLLLTPGAAQIYYGDELARPLTVSGAQGDANLRSFMNWEDLENNTKVHEASTQEVLAHWQKLGQFRHDHVAVGAGVHLRLQESPYIFQRTYDKEGLQDQVLVVLGLPIDEGTHEVNVFNLFEEGTLIQDYYSGKTATVAEGKVRMETPYEMLLLAAQ